MSDSTTGLASVLGKALIENFRLKVEDAIIAEINDPRNAAFPDERTGLRMARVILNKVAEDFANGT
jgi:hypothetical protein